MKIGELYPERAEYQHLEWPQFELIEQGQILLLTQKEEIDYLKAQASVDGILYFLERSSGTLHMISDVTEAKVLPEAGKISSAEMTRRQVTHPKLGVQTMVIRSKGKDYMLEKVMKKYNESVSREKLISAEGKYLSHVLYFDSVQAAKDFLLSLNDIQEVME